MTRASAGVVMVERRIKAGPATVFAYFTDPAKWLRWQGIEATIEPWPGGVFRMNVRGDGLRAGVSSRSRHRYGARPVDGGLAAHRRSSKVDS
jgi:uncharacterized protein YndB with AHSA1/START domain